MGNLCGKESKDNFTGPGRVLGSAPPPSNNAKASVPAKIASSKPKVGGPGRTVGGGERAEDDPRSAAAAAAEVRSMKLPSESGSRRAKPMTTTVWM